MGRAWAHLQAEIMRMKEFKYKEMKKTGELKRIDKILPKERKAFEFEIHAKPFIKPGEHSIGIKVMEHFDDYIDYKYVAKSYTKIVDLTVK